MQCPTDVTTLVMSERSGIEIDYCPECRGVNTVIFGTCGVCFAEFFEDDDDLQPRRDQLPSLVGPPRLATGEDPRHG